MVALPLLYSAWDFIFSQAPNCVNPLYGYLLWHADGVAGTSAGSYTALKAPQEAIKGFLVPSSPIGIGQGERLGSMLSLPLTLSRSSYSPISQQVYKEK